MKGIELSKTFFEEFGKPLLENEFKDLFPNIAVGFTGSGSDHYGYDDEISQDHDFEPGFTIFLPSEDLVSRKQEFLLEKAYAKLPKDFMGFKRERFSPVGGNRHGVVRISDYYEKAIGERSGDLSLEGWLKIPDYVLSEATNGEIFLDNLGEVTKIRENLMNMPLDVKLKRLAGNILIMAQSGEYNYCRCLMHKEPEAAALSVYEFVNASLKVLFLLNNKYSPYYKWSFRALRNLPGGEEIARLLGNLLINNEIDKCEIINKIVIEVKKLIYENDLLIEIPKTLEETAYKLNDTIFDGYVRNLNILYCI